MRRGIALTIGITLIMLAGALMIASTAVQASDGRIRMQSIRLPDGVRAGESIPLSIGLRQANGLALRRINTKAYIMDTGEITHGTELTSLRGRSQFVYLMLDTDQELPPGDYLIRIHSSVKTNSEDTSQRRTKTIRHRWITIEEP
ncbi:hypothetical protein HY641_01230 [Candidatus Woesearchaeota archaeon]|nr:hypothetical protein [Candidatus Woesearchaeota archaeon]